MADPTFNHAIVETNGIRMHLVEKGTGPLVILCHGWPGGWYSWGHQISALSDAGYHVVAPDQRGYGQTDRPDDVSAYTQFHLVGDIMGLLKAFGEGEAIIAGHDWGATVAWNAAMMRPDRFRAVIGLSIPFTQRSEIRPMQAIARTVGNSFFYQSYFQEPGVAEAELERDVRESIRRIYYSASGEAKPEDRWHLMMPGAKCFFDTTSDSGSLPMWLTQKEFSLCVEQFEQTGFRGSLNWYRNHDLTWELMAPFTAGKVYPPALFIGGDHDIAMELPGISKALDRMEDTVPNLSKKIILKGCGHWTQQEQPNQVNAALIEFINSL